jgi:pimeloyl-ACP methyl ester carboxylesterase
LGGRIASALLAEYPGRLRLAVIGGAGLVNAQGIPERRNLMAELADSLEQGKGVGPLLISLTPSGQPPPNAEQIEGIIKAFLAWNDPLALAAFARGDLAVPPLRNSLPVPGLTPPATSTPILVL